MLKSSQAFLKNIEAGSTFAIESRSQAFALLHRRTVSLQGAQWQARQPFATMNLEDSGPSDVETSLLERFESLGELSNGVKSMRQDICKNPHPDGTGNAR